MSTIIAIETSSELASAALLRGDQVIAREASGVQTHSQSLLPMVQELLREAEITLAQCDAVAFGAGPGSFTGVRTACGVAQGLGFGADLPVVPVVTLLAMAQACREASGASDVLVVMDARMEEVYWAQYRYDNGWQTLIEPTLSAASAVVPIGAVVACGNGLSAYAATFAAAFSQLPVAMHPEPVVMPHAAQVAQLAAIAFAEGRAVAARDAQPIYLRNKVALTTVERQAKVAA
jgi:tRNA threonylcarbamoyladenosine biosynthesis protein TsaB